MDTISNEDAHWKYQQTRNIVEGVVGISQNGDIDEAHKIKENTLIKTI